jgi:anti-anti-sigma factor
MSEKINIEELEDNIVVMTLDYPTIGTVQGNEIKRTLHGLIKKDQVKIILDLKNVRNANSFGLSLFFRMKNTLKENQGDLVIININDHMEELLKTAGLFEYFEVKGSKQEGIDFLKN